MFRALSPTQALGAGLVVYAEGRDMAEQAVNSLEFFRNESCGKCVPCRLGSQKMVSLGDKLAGWKNQSNALDERVVAAGHGDGPRHRADVDLRTRPLGAGAAAHRDQLLRRRREQTSEAMKSRCDMNASSGSTLQRALPGPESPR